MLCSRQIERIGRQIVGVTLVFSALANGLLGVVVSTTEGNTSQPSDDPGWQNVGIVRGSTGVYLGNRWMITANHIGAGDVFFPELGTFKADLHSQYRLPNSSPELSEFTDLLMFRLSDDPGLPPLQLAQKTPKPGTLITMIGNGRDRQTERSHWNTTGNGANAVWLKTDEEGQYTGYETRNSNSIRWGTNYIERDNLVERGSDRGNTVTISLGGNDVIAVLSEFDLDGSVANNFIRGPDRSTATEFEAQGVLNDSGGGMFFKEDGQWVLGGIIVAVSGFQNQPEPATNAIYGNTTFFADIASYRQQILNASQVPGDFDGDGVLTSDDINLLVRNLNSNAPMFDLDKSGTVDLEDHRIWVEELRFTYFGDANLDGQFSTSDMVQVFREALYEKNEPAGWEAGDWNGDQRFNTRDFVVAWQTAAFEKGPRPILAGHANVPEPNCMPPILLAISFILLTSRHVR